MRAPRIAAAAVLLAVASPAAAQLQSRSIALESGVSAPFSRAEGAHAAFALAATTWLDGPAEAIVRVGVAAAPRTAGREPSAVVSGTAGVRLSLLPDPLRPQLSLELGWARVGGPAGADGRLAFAVGAGLEWFPARDVSVAARGALRGVGSATSMELLLGLAAYF